MLNAAGDKSFVDDLAASGYCKCESSLCCYEALRFIPCFYDLFFFVFKISTCDFSRFGIQLREEFHQIWDFQFWGFCVCKNRRPFSVGSAFPFLPFKKSVCQYGVSHFCQSGIGETRDQESRGDLATRDQATVEGMVLRLRRKTIQWDFNLISRTIQWNAITFFWSSFFF